MFKFHRLLLSGIFLLAAATSALAQVEFNTDRNREVKQLKATGFMDYPPFGYVRDRFYPDSYESIFRPVIAQYAEEANFMVDYVVNLPYDVLVRKVRGGQIDIILGIYHETEKYKGLDVVYPALINNPVVVIMLPNRINEVNNLENLKKLKGGINSHEHLSDYVAEQMKNYQLEKVDNSYDLYKKLFNKEIDYIFASEYNARIEIAKMGLRNTVSFSKEAVWNMPLFIGISKAAQYRRQIFNGLTREAAKPESREKVRKALVDYIAKIEKESIGIVPPDFSK